MSLTFDEIKGDRERASKWLLAVAWLVEFCAAGIGIYLAIQTAQAAGEYLDESIILGTVESNVRLAMLPFMIIALVELTKIPLAYAVYHSRIFLWRLLFVLTLVFLCFLTTETVFFGLERSFNNQLAIVAEEVNQQEELEEDILRLDEERSSILNYSLVDLESSFNTTTQNLNGQLNLKLDEIEATRRSKIDDINKKIDFEFERLRKSQGTQLQELENQRDQKQVSLDQIINDRNTQISQTREDAAKNRETQRGIISAATTQESDLLEQQSVILEDSGIIRTNQTVGNFEKLIEDQRLKISQAQSRINETDNKETQTIENITTQYESRIASLNDDIEKLSDTIREDRAVSEQSFDRNREILEGQLQSTENSFDNERQRVIDQSNSIIKTETEGYEKEKAIIEQRRSNLIGVEQNLDSKKSTLITIKKVINEKYQAIQPLRIAKSLAREERASLADLEQEDINRMQIVWFGSVSLIAAITGTVIAFASFLLKDRDAFTPREKKKARKLISKSIRRLIINRRRFYKRRRSGIFSRFIDSISNLLTAIKDRLYRPVIKKEYIEKEVEIEKIVEVPKEIIRKEMVYVPFYSTEGGTLDISGQIKDMTNPEEIKQKISEITSSMTSEKEDE